jgi:hypothetical protein
LKGSKVTGAVVIALLMATARTEAQEGAARSELARFLLRAEKRHHGVRRNYEKLLREYPGFLPELRAIAARLQTRTEWLLNLIASESSFVPTARNPLPGQTASGLLQIIESTARGLGTTTSAIRRMDPVEQLHIVEKYFAPFRGRLGSLADVYAAAFRGFVVEGGAEAVVAPRNDSAKERRAYSLNRGLDLSRDGRITKGELEAVALGVGRFNQTAAFVSRAGSPLDGIRSPDQSHQSVNTSMSLYMKPSGDPLADRLFSEPGARPELAPERVARSIYFE